MLVSGTVSGGVRRARPQRFDWTSSNIAVFREPGDGATASCTWRRFTNERPAAIDGRWK